MPLRRNHGKTPRNKTKRKISGKQITKSKNVTYRKRVERRIGRRVGKRSGKGGVRLPTPAHVVPVLLNRPAQCGKARLPRQYASNCWLNACITSFFASQGMSAASLPLRERLHHPRSIPPLYFSSQMEQDLRQLSKVIEAIPSGQIKHEYSTAALIRGLLAIDKEGFTTPRNRLGAPVGRSHNPLFMYSALAKLLLPNSFQILKCDLTDKTGIVHESLDIALDASNIYNGLRSPSVTRIEPQVLFIEAGQETAESAVRQQLLASIAAENVLQAGGLGWRLDSVVMLDTTNSHFGGIVTCGGIPHSYDGMTGATLHPKHSWKRVVEQFRGRKIPTPAPEDFKYNIHNGYTIFAFVRA
jgi:hypothetical protein